MYICVAGKNNIAVDVLKYLVDTNNGRYELRVICNSGQNEIPGFQESLARAAEEARIPICSLDEVYGLPDLVFLSMEFDRIIKPDRFADARLYNIHFSLLPAYKGMYTSAMPILNAERYTGVTFHKIDAGIDTGDIIAQRRIEILDTDTCRDLYLKYIKHGTELVLENIEDVINDNVTAYPQSAEGASYYSKDSIDYSKLSLNFKDVAVSVLRQVRAYSFGEYQMPRFVDVDIAGCEIASSRSHEKPGTIITEEDDKFVVATIDYDVILYKKL